MIDQKKRSRQYSYLVGQKIKVYLGRVPDPAKTKVYEYSLFPMSNTFGEYVEVHATITKTYFNGKMITLDLEYVGGENLWIKTFNIPEDDVSNIVELDEEDTGLISIWSDLRAGDLVLFQEMSDWTKGKDFGIITKPTLAVIVGVDIWDMAVAVHYTEYKDFEAFKKDGRKEDPTPEVKSFGEWSDYWNVLGHWKTMPKLNELKQAYRTAKSSITLNEG